MSCPSAFALDEIVTHGSAPDEVTVHVAGCERCRQRVAQRRGEAERFAPAIPAVWRGILAARAARRRRWLLLPAIGAPLALAGALVLLMVPRTYTGAKGSLSMAVTVRRGDEVFAVDGSRPVQAGDALRFVPVVPSARSAGRFVALVSVDGTGTVWPFYPSQAGADSVPLPPAGQPLPGSIVLDDAPGPERLFVVVTDRPVPASAVMSAARAGGKLDGALVAAGARTSWLLLRKAPRVQGAP